MRGDFKSPYLKLFQGDARQDLALLEFYDYYQAGATSAGGVLLEYGDGSPAMASLHHGLGTLLLLNFSAGEFSSNLARQRIFPAWMQDLVKAISTDEPPPSSYTIGETLHTEIWRSEMRDDLLSPAGAPVTTQRELTGERCSLAFTPDQLGFYTLGSPRPAYAFGVNPATDRIRLAPDGQEACCPRNLPTSTRRISWPAAMITTNWPRAGRFSIGSCSARSAFLLLESGFQFLDAEEAGMNRPPAGEIVFDPILPVPLIVVARRCCCCS